MKRITIDLHDDEALRFITSLLELNKPFRVDTVVAQDPVVYAAAIAAPTEDAEGYAAYKKRGERNPDPPADMRARGLASAKVGATGYHRADRPGYRVQRLTADGRTSYEVVEQKVRSFKGRRFHMREIQGLAESSGFQPNTLQNQLSIMVGRGLLVKINKWEFRVPPELVKQGGAAPAKDPEPVQEAVGKPDRGELSGAGSTAPQTEGKASKATSTGQAASTQQQPFNPLDRSYQTGEEYAQ